MANAGRDDGYVTHPDIDHEAVIAAEADCRRPRYAGQNLMALGMEMPIGIDRVDPRPLPAIDLIQRTRGLAVARRNRQPAFPDDQRQLAVGNAAVRRENMNERRGQASFSLKNATVRPQAKSAASLL